jgi:CMP-N-acetylneuraminic acid synthetase
MLSLTEDRSYKWLMDEEGGVVPLLAEAPRRREARTPLYTEDSALYITRVEALRRTGFILGNSAAGYVMDPLETIDVNELTDLELVEAIVQARRRGAR